jgi:hypothetical protein
MTEREGGTGYVIRNYAVFAVVSIHLASDTQITFGWDDYSTVSKKLAKLLDSR